MGKTFEKPQSLYPAFERKGGAEPDATHYCPGCGHGIVHKLVAEILDDLDIRDRTILISPVGCSVFAYYYFDTGNIQAAHGRAPAVATGVKRARPESIVISYQGDGDLAAIGGNNILQAANRGENITVIFINNAIYGMTGGQLAPTSLIGMKTATTPEGRKFVDYGGPLRVAELLAPLDGVSFSARHALTSAANIQKTRKALAKALRYQLEGKGFSLVEILSQCPTGWKMDPVDSLHWIEENMVPVFPLGTYKDEPRERPEPPRPAAYDPDLVRSVIVGDRSKSRQRESSSGAPWSWPLLEGRPEKTIGLKSAGFGGQGVLVLGELLARAGILEGLHVTWLPSYGPEMRGGTANCSVVFSVDPVGNPMVDRPNVLVALNRPSLERFVSDLRPGGVLLYDSSLIDSSIGRTDIFPLAIPATKIANDLGQSKVANVVMIGALAGLLGFPRRETLEPLLTELSRTETIRDANLQAIQRGIEAAEKSREEVGINR